MQTINQLSNAEIGERLMKLHTLGGMIPPTDAPATANYIKSKYGNYYASLLDEAIEWHLNGSNNDPSRTITAMFIIKAMRTYMAGAGKREWYPRTRTYQTYQPTPEELLAVSRKAMRIIAIDYYKEFYLHQIPDFRLSWKAVESLYDYVLNHGFTRELEWDDLEKYTNRINQYAERKRKKSIENIKQKDPLRNIGYSKNDQPSYDAYKVAMVIDVIEQRIKNGWKPDTNEL